MPQSPKGSSFSFIVLALLTCRRCELIVNRRGEFRESWNRGFTMYSCLASQDLTRLADRLRSRPRDVPLRCRPKCERRSHATESTSIIAGEKSLYHKPALLMFSLEDHNAASAGFVRLRGGAVIRAALGAIFGFVCCFALTYAPLYAATWVRLHIKLHYALPVFFICWVPLVQVLPPIFLWVRSRGIALGFLAYLAMEVLLVIAMLAGLLHPV